MKSINKWIAVFILLLALPALACGFGGNDDEQVAEQTIETGAGSDSAADNAGNDTTTAQSNAANDSSAASGDEESPEQPSPTDTPTEEPNPTDEPTAESADEPSESNGTSLSTATGSGGVFPGLKTSTDSLNEFNSYQLNMTMNFDGETTDGEPITATMMVEAITIKEPAASNIVVTMSGLQDFPDGEQQMVIAQFDDLVYAIVPEFGCISSTANEMAGATSEFDELTNPEELIGDLEDAEFIGEQTHGGYVSDCYTFDETNINDMNADIENGMGLLCISQEFGHISYMRLEGEGSNDAFGATDQEATGTTIIEMTTMGINEDFEIVIPEGCENSGADALYPILEDATEVSTLGDLLIYTTSSSLEETMDFYIAEMESLGYIVGEEQTVTEGLAIIPFIGPDGNLQLLLSTSDDVAGTQVMITPEEE